MSDSLALQLRERAIALRQASRIDEAIIDYRRALDLWRTLVNGSRPDTNTLRNLSIAANDLAGALHVKGDSSEALDYYEEGLKALDMAVDSDPENIELLRDQAITFGRIAMTCLALKQWDEAIETGDGAVAIFSKLAQDTPAEWGAQFDLAIALQHRA